MSESASSNQGSGGSSTSVAAVVTMLMALMAGFPLAMNEWQEFTQSRSQQQLRETHLARAGHYVRQGRYSMAAVGYKKAQASSAIDPRVTTAADHLLVLSAVRSPGRLTGSGLDEVEYIVERALASGSPPPHREYYLSARGAVQAIRGQVEESLKSFELAVKQAPEFAAARYFRGKVLADVGREADAIPELEKAFSLDGSQILARQRLARIRANAGDLDAAAGLLQKAIDLGGGVDTHFLMGAVRNRQKKHDQALASLVKVGQLDPKYPKLGESMGQTLFALKRFEEASKVLSRTFERTRSIDTYYLIGMCALNLGDRQRAANIFQAIVNNRPKHVRARYELARLFDQTGDQARARGHYRAFAQLAATRDDLADEIRFVRSRLETFKQAGASAPDADAAQPKRGKKKKRR